MDVDVKDLLKKAVVIESQEKPLAALEKIVDEQLGEAQK
jgi:hypothetical protein